MPCRLLISEEKQDERGLYIGPARPFRVGQRRSEHFATHMRLDIGFILHFPISPGAPNTDKTTKEQEHE